MPADPVDRFDLLDRLAEEFAARFRRGERPSLKEYLDRYPDLADDIREMLPALASIEQVEKDVRSAEESCAGPPARAAPEARAKPFSVCSSALPCYFVGTNQTPTRPHDR